MWRVSGQSLLLALESLCCLCCTVHSDLNLPGCAGLPGAAMLYCLCACLDHDVATVPAAALPLPTPWSKFMGIVGIHLLAVYHRARWVPILQ